MKRIITMTLLVTILLSLFAGIDSFATSDYTFDETDEGLIITKYTPPGNNTDPIDLVIPSSWESKPIVGIGDGAFRNCYRLSSVTIPDGVTSIGKNAFQDCLKLTGISIPDSVLSIGEDAFTNSKYYSTSNNWKDGVLYIGHHLIAANYISYPLKADLTVKDGTVCIADNAFDNTVETPAQHQTNLTTISFPNTLKCIGDKAFKGCYNLTDFALPSSLTRIDLLAFQGCTSITRIDIPDGVTHIGGSVFSGCTQLENISIPDGVVSIGSFILQGTKYYNNKENWENGALYVGKHLVETQGLSGFYQIKDGTLTIASHALANQTLSCLVVPSSVTHINSNAVYCNKLKTMYLPATVTHIAEDAFYVFPNNLDFTIYGEDGSTAEQYAQKHNISFAVMQGATFTPQIDTTGENIVVTATIPAKEFENTLYLACYDKNDILINLAFENFYADGHQVQISKNADIAYIKAFLWEYDSVTPIGDAVRLDVTAE